MCSHLLALSGCRELGGGGVVRWKEGFILGGDCKYTRSMKQNEKIKMRPGVHKIHGKRRIAKED